MRRAICLVLSWIVPATSVWATAPPLQAQARRAAHAAPAARPAQEAPPSQLAPPNIHAQPPEGVHRFERPKDLADLNGPPGKAPIPPSVPSSRLPALAVSPQGPVRERVFAAAAAVAVPEVLFVTGTGALGAGDRALQSRLTSLGLKVTVVAASVVTTGSAAGKSLVLVSESVTPSDVGTKFRSVAVPVVSLDPGVLPNLGMTATAATNFGTQANQTSVVIPTAGAAHALAAGLTGTVSVTLSSSPFGWGTPGTSAVKVATLTGTGNTNKATVFAYTSGATMVGLTAPARRKVELGRANRGRAGPSLW